MSTTPPPPPAGAPPPPPGAPPPPPGGAPPPPVGGGVPPGVPYGGPSTSAFGPGQIIALVGAAVVALSTLLNWIDFEGETASAHNVPAQFLLDTDKADKGGLGVGWLLIILMLVVVVGVFAAQVRWLAIVGGGAGAIVALLFVFQVSSFLDDAKEDFGVDIDLFDFITYFPFLAVVGSVAAIVGGVIALRQP